ncbi:hypothetical protein VN97_g12709 [Penicillium thymicola]|uniref:Uncharacterized protein n=1 Tax=Penicillium thymicola TaxID=293382 RepID=A0AAI9T5W2_PENTH|nr:hypothetical protein VN97_g12709 [Penicillium thymicola]
MWGHVEACDKFYQEVVDHSEQGSPEDNPSLFCSEKWRWRTRWVHDSQTGKNTGTLLKDDPNCKIQTNMAIFLATNTDHLINRNRMAGMVSPIQRLWPGKHHVQRKHFCFHVLRGMGLHYILSSVIRVST